MAGPWDSSNAGRPWTKYATGSSDVSDSGSSINPEAAAHGYAQFSTAGYLPEITAGVEKGMLAAKSMLPLSASDKRLQAQGVKLPTDLSYEDLVNENRAQEKSLAAQNPGSYYGGGVMGAFASAPLYGAALKGLGIAKDVPAMAEVAENAPLAQKAGAYASNLGSRMLQTAKEGAALGFVSNPNTNPGDQGLNLEQRAQNAAMTGSVSAAIPPAWDLLKGSVNTIGQGGSKLLSYIGGANPDAIKEYSQFSDRINSAPGPDQLKQISDDFVGKLSNDVDAKKLSVDQAKQAYQGFQTDIKNTYQTAAYDARDAVTSAQQTLKDAQNAKIQQVSGDVYDKINQLKSDIQQGSGQALKTLDKSNSMIDLAPTYSTIDNTIGKLQKSGTDDSLAIADKLQTYKDRLIANNGTTVAAPDAKKLVQGLDQITTYSPMAGSFDQAKNAAFKGVRSSLDQTLKGTVPEYQQQMQSVASDSDLLNRVSDFGDKQTAAGLLNRINAPNQMERKAALDQLGQKYGTDFIGAVDPKNLPENQFLEQALAKQDSLRPDVVKQKIMQTLASSREQTALTGAQQGLESSEAALAPFKSLAPNSSGQTQSQQKLAQLGQGKNVELTDMFQKLGKLTDTDFIQAMKDNNTLASFQKGAANGSRNTLIGGITGWMFGGIEGAAVGASAMRAVDQWGPAMTKKALDVGIQVSKMPNVQSMSQAISNASLPSPIKQNMMNGLQNYMANQSNQKFKGEDLWAQQGLQKIGIQDPAVASKLLQDQKSKRLLIQASDLKAGSPAMNNVMKQIQKGFGVSQ